MSGAVTGMETDWSALQATLGKGAVLVTASGAEPYGQALMTAKHVVFGDVAAEF